MLAGTFILPAFGRLLWDLIQRSATHLRNPDWPQEGILLGADWGLTINWSTLLLTYLGLLVYYILAGVALAATTSAVSALLLGQPSGIIRSYAESRPQWLRCLWLQLVSALYAWGAFLAGVIATVLFGATALASNRFHSAGPLIWYALMGFAFLVGAPFGLWMHIRYALAVPASCLESLRVNASLKRSAELSKGYRKRILGGILLLGGLRWIVEIALDWLFHFLSRAHVGSMPITATAAFPLVSFMLDALLGPIYGITIALIYYQIAAETTPTGAVLLERG
jgi:hypothetical protein